MKLAHPDIQTVLDFSKFPVWQLVIENPLFFRTILSDLSNQLRSEDGNIILSDKEKPLEIAGNLEIIDNFWQLELNDRHILSKIAVAAEKLAAQAPYDFEINQILSQLESCLIDITMDFPCDIACGKLSFGSIIKAAGLSIVDDSSSDVERLLNYMELIREFDKDKVFVLVNAVTYFSVKELQSFAETASAHNYQVLLLDGKYVSLHASAKQIIIDNDLCEM